MPPFVDHAEVSAITSQSTSSESLLSRSKSADDLMHLKNMAIAATPHGRRNKSGAPASRSQSVGASKGKPPAPPTSMEWVGSYFFYQCSRNPVVDVSQFSEEDMIVFHTSPDGDGDDSTVGAHFAESDFLTSNWTDAVEYIPPVGFAVVAGGLCLMNPILFIGGILTACTALGAVHAAQTTYDTCIDGNMCQIFEKNATEENKAGSEKALDPSSPVPLKTDLSDVTFNMAGMEDAVSEVDVQGILTEQALLEDSSSGETPLPQDPSTLDTSEQALEWVNQYYPPLSYKNVENLEFCGLNALEFFDVFLADDAPFTFCEFQRKRQDKNIRYGNWEDLAGVTQPSLVQAAAVISSPAAKDKKESPLYHNHLKERVLHFKAKTNAGIFGPPYATTTKVQRCLVANKRLLVLESKTTLKDIPFCDRFYVMERWLITSEKRADQYVSNVSVSCQVVFSKSCSFESTIISKSQETVSDIAMKWNEMAQTALRWTEQTRRERLEQDTQTTATPPAQNACSSAVPKKTASMDSSVEVERMSRTASRILGQSDEETIPVVMDEEKEEEGKPPKIPNSGKSNTRRRVRKSLSRSLSKIMTRRNSNPL
jgi:hypothetical protein